VSIQWGRVLLAAFLMELVLFAIGPAALIGVKGTRMYVALTATQPEPWQYLLAHGLKITGGAAAGVELARRQSATSLPSENQS
jgi:hypothetical protein